MAADPSDREPETPTFDFSNGAEAALQKYARSLPSTIPMKRKLDFRTCANEKELDAMRDEFARSLP